MSHRATGLTLCVLVLSCFAACQSSTLYSFAAVGVSCGTDEDCAFYLACADGACRYRCSIAGGQACSPPDACRVAAGATDGICLPPEVAPIPPAPPAPPPPIDAVYAGVCVTPLTQRDPERPLLRLYVETSYLRDPEMGDGELSLALTPMRSWDMAKQAPFVPPFRRSERRGQTSRIVSMPVSASGLYTVSFGTLILNAEANGVSGQPARLEAVTLAGVFNADSFCATLAGKLDVPSSVELKASENTCVFFKRREGDAFPLPEARDFVCALPK